jgi:RNA polymerase sigma factor (sigma-70 family)
MNTMPPRSRLPLVRQQGPCHLRLPVIVPNERKKMNDKDTHFKALIQVHKDSVYRLCLCYVRDPDARMDVFQEVLVNLWKSLTSFEGRSQVSTWIYRVTVNTCLGYLRSERRRKKVFDNNPGVELGDIAAEGAEAAHMERDVAHLYACIGQLEAVDRALVSLYLEDISTREMADILGISEGNVRVKLHRVKKSLKEIWERTNDGLE